MSDKELIARLRGVCTCNIDSTPCMAEDHCRDALAAADRIEALVKERDEAKKKARYWSGEYDTVLAGRADEYDRAERLEAALRKIDVGDGWAAEIARAALREIGGQQ